MEQQMKTQRERRKMGRMRDEQEFARKNGKSLTCVRRETSS